MRVFHLAMFAVLSWAWATVLVNPRIESDLIDQTRRAEFNLEAGSGRLADELRTSPALEHVRAGEEVAKEKTICVGGLVHNGAFTLPRAMDSLMEMVGKFADYRVVLLENDSTDHTKDVMRERREKLSPHDQQRVVLSMHDFGAPVNGRDPLGAVRFQGLARLRNRLLREMRAVCNSAIPGAVFAFVDMDSWHGWEAGGVASSFRPGLDPWGAMCANGVVNDGSTWDALAFRSDAHPNTKRGKHWLVFHQMSAVLRMYVTGPDPLPVRSCFGGLALYSNGAAQACDYDEATEDCEHVSFNACAARFGTVAINPYMVLYYGSSAAEVWISHTYAARANAWIAGKLAVALLFFLVLAVRDKSTSAAAPVQPRSVRASDNL